MISFLLSTSGKERRKTLCHSCPIGSKKLVSPPVIGSLPSVCKKKISMTCFKKKKKLHYKIFAAVVLIEKISIKIKDAGVSK